MADTVAADTDVAVTAGVTVAADTDVVDMVVVDTADMAAVGTVEAATEDIGTFYFDHITLHYFFVFSI